MAESLFTEAQKQQITGAIAKAEALTSGEIRVHIERVCKEDVLDHAAFIFEQLQMHKTALRNGVLFYISYHDHKLAILGDVGINAKVGPDFWVEIKDHMVTNFKSDAYTKGLSEAILMAGEALATHFPKGENNPNELSNEISFGDTTTQS